MQQVVLHKFHDIDVEYVFTDRSHFDLSPYIEKIREEIGHLEVLTLSESEYHFLKKRPFLKPDYLEYLKYVRLNPHKYVKISLGANNTLDIRIKGPWVHTILFEVPILAIVSEIYCTAQAEQKGISQKEILDSALQKLEVKADLVKNMEEFKFADFGTRRRYSYELHKFIVENCKRKFGRTFVGTSNVRFAMLYDTKPIGTMAHEYLMAHQQIYNLKEHQERALNNWAHEYHGLLGIVLTDTLTSDVFIRDFHLGHAKLFDGIRQDSGDPYEICEKFIAHYNSIGIDPLTKTIIFSDSLNFPKAIELYNTFKGRIGISFGIGTNVTNDVDKITPLNIVIKLTKVNGFPVAKLSDSQGKEMCGNQNYLNYLKDVFHVKK
jgi:nicotinate phosphoribosyltransferase